MSRALMISGESNDWCGISETFVFWTDIEDEDEALDAALSQFADSMDEALLEFYDEEDLVDENGDDIEYSMSYKAEWHTEDVYGDASSPAYHRLN